MRQIQDNWQRIESVIEWANMTTNYFARYIGLPRGENLYQIKRGNNGISRDVAERIVSKFPDIYLLWLLTGAGSMFTQPSMNGEQVPYYRYDVERMLLNLDMLDAECEFILPPLSDCEFAMVYYGRAMGSLMPPGTIVFLRQIDKLAIIPGVEYVIVSGKVVTLRLVIEDVAPESLRLVAADKVHFNDTCVKLSDVDVVYKVVGKLIINN